MDNKKNIINKKSNNRKRKDNNNNNNNNNNIKLSAVLLSCAVLSCLGGYAATDVEDFDTLKDEIEGQSTSEINVKKNIDATESIKVKDSVTQVTGDDSSDYYSIKAATEEFIGFDVDNSDLGVKYLNFENYKTTTGSGGAINIKNGNLSVEDSIFKNNTSIKGGAVNNDANMTVTGSSFIGNIQTGTKYGGGAIRNAGYLKLIDNNVFNGNKADLKGGAISNVGTDSLDIFGSSSFVNNATVGETTSSNIFKTGGGAIYNDGELNLGTFETPLTSLEMKSNSTNGSGGAIFNDKTGIASVYGNALFGGATSDEGNNAAGRGGAIFNLGILNLNSMSGTILFENNVSGQEGGALRNAGTLSIIGNTVYENNKSQMSGGAISNIGEFTISGNYNFENNYATLNGGAIYNLGDLTITGSADFSGNRANAYDEDSREGGGAIYNKGGNIYIIGTRDASGDSSISFNGNAVLNAGIKGAGGAINVQGDGKVAGSLYISGVDFIGNQSGRAGAIRGGDGGFTSNPAELYINDCYFEGNMSDTYGGAIGSGGNANIYVSNSVFKGNAVVSDLSTAYNGGAITNGAELLIVNSKFYDNHAHYNGGAVVFNGTELRLIADKDDIVFSGNTIDNGSNIVSNGLGFVAKAYSKYDDPVAYINAGNGGKFVSDDKITTKYGDDSTRTVIHINKDIGEYSYKIPDVNDIEGTKFTDYTATAPVNGTVQINNTVEKGNLILYNGLLEIGADPSQRQGTDRYFYKSDLELKGGTLSFANGNIEAGNIAAPDSFTVSGASNLWFDVDLSAQKIDYIDTDIACSADLTVNKILFSGEITESSIGDAINLQFAKGNSGNAIKLADTLRTVITSDTGYSLGLTTTNQGNDTLSIKKIISAGGLPVAVSIGDIYGSGTYIYSSTEDETVSSWGLNFDYLDDDTVKSKTTSNVLDGDKLVINGNGKNIIKSGVPALEGIKLGTDQVLEINDVIGWSYFDSAVINEGGEVDINNSTFSNNVSSTNGGAVRNTDGGVVKIINSSFLDNAAAGKGGAIYNNNGSVYISAKDNYESKFDNTSPIYNENNGVINIVADDISKVIFNDKIVGDGSSKINIGWSYNDNGTLVSVENAGTVIFNDTVSNSDVTLNGGTLKIGDGATAARTDYFDNVNFIANGGVLDLQNNQLDTLNLNNFTLNNKLGLELDVNLSGDNLSDKIVAGGFTDNGSIEIADITLSGAMPGGVSRVVSQYINKAVSNAEVKNTIGSITYDGTVYSVSLVEGESDKIEISREGESGGFAYEVAINTTPERTYQIGSSDTNVGAWIEDNNNLAGKVFTINGGTQGYSLIGDGLKGIALSTGQTLNIRKVGKYTDFEGAVSNNGGIVNIDSTLFTLNNGGYANTTTGESNGGVISNNAGKTVISGNSSFINNSADDKGGAIYNNGTLVFNIGKTENVIFDGNTANGNPNDIYQTSSGETNINGEKGGTLTVNDGIAGAGTINKISSVNLVLNGDNSGYTGKFNVAADEENSDVGSITVGTGAKFFGSGAKSEISNSILNWYTNNDIENNSAIILDETSSLVVGNGTDAAQLSVKGGSSIGDAQSITINENGSLSLHKNTEVKNSISGDGNLILNGSKTLTFKGDNADIEDSVNFQTTNGLVNIDGVGTAGKTDSLITKILSGTNTLKGLKLQLTDTSSNKDIYIDNSRLNELDAIGDVTYGGTLTGAAGKGTVTHKGEDSVFTVTGDASGFTGIFNQSAGTTSITESGKIFGGTKNINAGNLYVVSNNAVDYGKINLASDTNYKHTTKTTDVNTIGSSIFSFNSGASGATAEFTSDGVVGNYLLSDDISNGTGNTVKFANSVLSLGSTDYSGGAAYELDNVELNLIDDIAKDYTFKNLTANNSKINLDLAISSDTSVLRTLESDTLTVENGSPVLQLGTLKLSGVEYESGQKTYEKQVLTGATFDPSVSTFDIATTAYEYIGSIENGNTIKLTGNKVANANSLNVMNTQTGLRYFQFFDGDTSHTYTPASSLDATENGTFYVSGRTDASGAPLDTISGADAYALFNIGSDKTTEIHLNDIIFANANTSGFGSVLSNLSSTSSVYVDNVKFNDNVSNSGGGALYLAKGTADIQNGEFNANHSAAGAGAIYAGGGTDITNTSFYNNYSESSTNSAGALYLAHDVNIIADGGDSIFKGNYVLKDGAKDYVAIASSGANPYTANLSAVNGGKIELYDKADNVSLTLSGDSTGVIGLYNDITNIKKVVINEDINVDMVNDTANVLNVKNFNSDASADYALDFIKTGDTITNDLIKYTTGSGTVTLDSINFIGDFSGTNLIRVLDGDGTVKLSLSQDLIDAYYVPSSDITTISYETFDPVTSNSSVFDPTLVKWGETVNKVTTHEVKKGGIELAKTVNTADSVLLTNINETTSTKEGTGDLLAFLNQYQTDDVRNFVSDNVSDVYTSTKDVGVTSEGKFNITGATHESDNYSTINLNNHTGLEIKNKSEVNISNVKITGAKKTTTVGGSVVYVANEDAVVTIKDSFFENNYSQSNGGVIKNAGEDIDGGLVGGTINIENVIFKNNETAGRGGVIRASGGEINITDSVFESNVAVNNGGALATLGAQYNGKKITFNIKDTVFKDNSITTKTASDGGGAMGFGVDAIVNFDNVQFIGNHSDYTKAGAIQNNFSAITIDNSVFSGNYAGTNGGAIYDQPKNGYNAGFIKITNSEFKNNYIIASASTSQGGAMYLNGGNYGEGVTVENTSFTGNTAKNGGAVYVNNSGNGVTFTDVIFDNNGNGNSGSSRKADIGGAVYAGTAGAKTIKFENATFSNNYAKNGSAIYNNSATIEIGKAVFSGNTGNSYIYNNNGTIHVFDDNTFDNGKTANIVNNKNLNIDNNGNGSVIVSFVDDVVWDEAAATSNNSAINIKRATGSASYDTVVVNFTGSVKDQNKISITNKATVNVSGDESKEFKNNNVEIENSVFNLTDRDITGGKITFKSKDTTAIMNVLHSYDTDVVNISSDFISSSGNYGVVNFTGNGTGADTLVKLTGNDYSGYKGAVNLTDNETVEFAKTADNKFFGNSATISVKDSHFIYDTDEASAVIDKNFSNARVTLDNGTFTFTGTGKESSEISINSEWLNENTKPGSTVELNDASYILKSTFTDKLASSNVILENADIYVHPSIGEGITTPAGAAAYRFNFSGGTIATDSKGKITSVTGGKQNVFDFNDSVFDLTKYNDINDQIIAGDVYVFDELNMNNSKLALNVNLLLVQTPDGTGDRLPYSDEIFANRGSGTIVELTKLYITDDNGKFLRADNGTGGFIDKDGNPTEELTKGVIQVISGGNDLKLAPSNNLEILTWATNIYKYGIRTAKTVRDADSIEVYAKGNSSNDTLRDLNQYVSVHGRTTRGFNFITTDADGDYENSYNIYRDLDTTNEGTFSVIGSIFYQDGHPLDGTKSVLDGKLESLVLLNDELGERLQRNDEGRVIYYEQDQVTSTDVTDYCTFYDASGHVIPLSSITTKEDFAKVEIGVGAFTKAGEEYGSFFEISGDKATNLDLITMTIQNAKRYETDTIKDGSVIYSDNPNAVITLTGVDLVNNTTEAGKGGAIYNASSKELIITDSIIKNNGASDNGGAIYNASSGKTELTNVTAYGNVSGGLGGAIYTAADMKITDSDFGVDENGAISLNLHQGTKQNDIYVDNGATVTFTVSDGNINSVNSGIAGKGNFVKSGTGTLNLAGKNEDFTGGLNITAGNLFFEKTDDTEYISGSTTIDLPGSLDYKTSQNDKLTDVSGKGTLNKLGTGTLTFDAADNTGFTGTVNVKGGQVDTTGSSETKFDFNTVIYDGVFNYTSVTDANISVGGENTQVIFDDGATNAKAIFNGTGDTKYILDEIQGIYGNSVTVKDATVNLAINNYAKGSYSIIDSVIDLQNDEVTDNIVFNDLSTSNTKLKIDMNFDVPGGIKADKLTATTSTGDDSKIALTEINVTNYNDNGTGNPDDIVIPILGGSLKFDTENSLKSFFTEVYEYSVSASGQNLILTALKAADENSLKKMNEYEGVRQFTFTNNDDDNNPYAIGDSLGTTKTGTFTVTGTGNTVISGSNTYSMFEVTENKTDLTISGVTIEKAKTTGNGSVVNNTDAGSTVTIKDSTIKANNSDGLGGAIYAAGTLNITDTNFSNNSDGTGANDIYIAGTTGEVNYTTTKDSSISSGISGTGTFNKEGSKTLTLSGTNENFTGDLNINAGDVLFTQKSAIDTYISGTTDVNGNKLTLDNELSDITIGALTGADTNGTVDVTGGKDVKLTGDNSGYTGSLNIKDGSSVSFEKDASSKYISGNTTVDSGTSLNYKTTVADTLTDVSGSGTVNKSGADKLTFNAADNSGFDGTVNVKQGQLDTKGNTDGDFDFNTVISGSGKLNYTSVSGATINIGGTNTKVKFDDSASEASAIFNGTGTTKYILDEMQGVDGNYVTINNAIVNLAKSEYLTGDYTINNSTIDLQNSNATDNIVFDNLSTSNTKLKIDMSFDNVDGIKSDKLTATTGTGDISIALTDINLTQYNDNGTTSATVQVLDGNLKFDSAGSLGAWSTDVYQYDVKTSGQSITFTALKAADDDSLKAMNVYEGVRQFTFTNDDNNPYVIGTSLGQTADGTFTVTGTGSTVISGGGTKSMFEVTENNTDLRISGVTMENAATTGNGSVVNNTATGSTVTITNSTIKDNNSGGLGGAIYAAGTVDITDTNFSNNSDGTGANDIYIAGTGEVNYTTNKDSSISSGIAGSGTFNKEGSETLTLSGTNENFTGDLNINSGDVLFTQKSAIDTYISGTTDVNGNKLTLDNDKSDITIGAVTGSGTIDKTGGKDVTLSGDNSGYTGSLNIKEGSVTVNTDTTKYIAGPTDIDAGASLVVNNNNNTSFSDITGSGAVVKNGGGVFAFDGDNSGFTGDLTVNNGTVAFNPNATIGNLNNVTFADGTALNLQNTVAVQDADENWTTNPNPASIESLNFANLVLNGDVALKLDIDLKNGDADSISADSVTGGGHFILGPGSLNVVSDALLKNTSVTIASGALATGDNIILAKTVTTVMGPIQRYNVNYASGVLNFTAAGGGRPDINSVNPAVMAAPVATQLSGYLAQLQTLQDGFYHMDRYMKYTKKVRFAAENANKYATTEVSPYEQAELPLTSEAMWTKPYTTFERVPLKGGLGVSNVMYGAIYGGDTDLTDLGHGWEGIISGFVGYNGAHQAYRGISMNQQGGALGMTGSLYKGNFFTGVTMSVGANTGSAYTNYGTDNFSMVTAGIANKTGYNIEFSDGKYIVQPLLFLGYTFAKTLDYTNAADVRIDSDALHSIQVAPGVKFIANLKNGWQPYAEVDVVSSIMDKTAFQANDVVLPELSVKPYAQYGVGVSKSWGEKFNAFFQTMVRSGGRNGVSLTFGFRWNVGKDSKQDNRPTTKKYIKGPENVDCL